MSLRSWLRRLFAGRKEGQQDRPAKIETVPYLDAELAQVVNIPAVELAPGAVQVRLQIEGRQLIVWADPAQLHEGEYQHPPFAIEVKQKIEQIRRAFAEHRTISFEQWEEGFRRDHHPDREIAHWLHAADVYGAFAAPEFDSERRRDIYRCVIACLTTSREDVHRVLRTTALSPEEADEIVDRFFA